MILFILFSVLGVIFAANYFLGRQKFMPYKLLLCVWLLSIAVSQFRLSPLEKPWTTKFWLILIIFLVLFYVASKIFSKIFNQKISENSSPGRFLDGRLFFAVLLLMAIFSVGANIYIYNYFQTLPILSSIPDRMRFAINKEIFGLWEYGALLPRLAIPLTFIYLLLGKTKKKWPKILAYINIVLGFVILSLYASRLTIIFPILMCYFIYLLLRLKEMNLKKIISASVAVVLVVLIISIAIPAVRQHITYRDYYLNEEDDAFSYIMTLSELKIPDNFRWVAPLYIIPAFNLQAFFRATDFFGPSNFYYGQYGLSTLDPFLKIAYLPVSEIKIPWKQMFLPWWITATFLFNYWADFGYWGVIFAAIFWAILLSGVYYFAVRKSGFISTMLFAYFSFMVIMSIYTNYFLRQELYLDILVIAAVGFLVNKLNKNRA
ncbi:MAG: O-antigen polymerase [Patescibacteria group bacterium]